MCIEKYYVAQCADCRVDFTLLNFSIITIQCRGQKFEAASCCRPFKDFACPFANAINDPKTGYAAALFDYVRKMGNYPRGVFQAQCPEGDKVVSCPPQPSSMSHNSNATTILLLIKVKQPILTQEYTHFNLGYCAPFVLCLYLQ